MPHLCVPRLCVPRLSVPPKRPRGLSAAAGTHTCILQPLQRQQLDAAHACPAHAVLAAVATVSLVVLLSIGLSPLENGHSQERQPGMEPLNDPVGLSSQRQRNYQKRQQQEELQLLFQQKLEAHISQRLQREQQQQNQPVRRRRRSPQPQAAQPAIPMPTTSKVSLELFLSSASPDALFCESLFSDVLKTLHPIVDVKAR